MYAGHVLQQLAWVDMQGRIVFAAAFSSILASIMLALEKLVRVSRQEVSAHPIPIYPHVAHIARAGHIMDNVMGVVLGIWVRQEGHLASVTVGVCDGVRTY